MPMHDHFAKVGFAQKEILSNPEQVIFRLLGQADSRSDSCVHKEKITADEIWLKAAQEFAVGGWKNSVELGGEFSSILRIGLCLWHKSI